MKKVDWKGKLLDIYLFIYNRLYLSYYWIMPWSGKLLRATIFASVKIYQSLVAFYIINLTRIADYMLKTGYEKRRQNYIKQSYHMRNHLKLDNRKQGKFLNRLKRTQLRYYKRYLKLGHKHAKRHMRGFVISVKLNKVKVKIRKNSIMFLFKIKKFYKKLKPYDMY